MTESERRIRQRLKDDLPHYAAKCLRIRTKDGRIAPLVLNTAQLHIHDALETQRRDTGKVRALILKARQEGASTYVQARYYHAVTHGFGRRAFILTHEDKATSYIFEMADRFHRHCPAPVRPHAGIANAKEMVFDQLDSGYGVGTARAKETGRSFTIQFFHGSEVAYWPNAQSHMAASLQAVGDVAGTEIILESTSAGASGLFYELWQAAERGDSDYQAIFVPWFWMQEYRRTVPQGFVRNSEEDATAALYGLDDEQVVWRRFKIAQLGNVYAFRREYPATAQEAFSAERPGAFWGRELLGKTRVVAPPPLVRIVVAIDPASKSNPNSSETGIVVAGLGRDGHGYVLADLSLKALPAVWARRAIEAGFDAYSCDRVIYESNQGGDMVKHTLQTVRPNIALKEVIASKSKQARAEPIAALFDEGKCHMVGTHIALEDQLCNWEPQSGDESPDRLDAMVWALWELTQKPQLPDVRPWSLTGPSNWSR